MYSMPVVIEPKSRITLENCSAAQAEKIVLEFRATKKFQAGCIKGETPIGVHNELAIVGTDVPGKIIVLHSYDF